MPTIAEQVQMLQMQETEIRQQRYKAGLFRMLKPAFFCLCFLIVCCTPLQSQVNRVLTTPSAPLQPEQPPQSQQAFFMDVLFFKGDQDSTQRVDVFVVVPYQSLNFMKRDSVFIGDYILTITLKDQSGREVQTIRKEHPIKEERLEVTLGSTGVFDYTQTTLSVTPGTYTITTEIADVLSKRTFNLQRSFKALNTGAAQFAMSSVMFASSVVPNGQRINLTPYLADDVSPLTQEGFFAFFETYNAFGPSLDSLDFVYEVIDDKGLRPFLSKRLRRSVAAAREQQYIKISLPAQLPIGSYTLRLLALRTDTSAKYTERDVIAASARTMRLDWKGLGMLAMLRGDDLTKAIRQMRYVASPQEISAMHNSSTEEEKQRRFFEYWQRLDPTPATLRNEAFEDYYQRVDYANRNFRAISFGDGWMSDMGMVYIIFGPPQYTRDFRRDGRIIWTWSYPTYGREFVFVDYTGFGNDFRLTSGMPFERYRYRR
ncbi:MAG: GWxTD domain-containing protein [Ignavibacteria bacterium]|nr:GWxTD domain-containing protein [Ignavibacteria bacterium]